MGGDVASGEAVMTPAQKRRAKRRKNLQRKRPAEMQLVRSGNRLFGERLVLSNPNETLTDARKMGV